MKLLGCRRFNELKHQVRHITVCARPGSTSLLIFV